MKKIINKNGTVSAQFTKNDIKEVKKAFNQDVEKFLEKRFTISLPLFAIKLLIEACNEEVLSFDYMMEHGMAISNREGVEAESKAQIPGIIAIELDKQNFEGTKFTQNIQQDVKERWNKRIALEESQAQN